MIVPDNAVIMAAGFSSRFLPLSWDVPKGLTLVRGEILIERQIRQLREAGVKEIYVVTGYKAEQFRYLEQKCGVHVVENTAYDQRNNHSSIYVVRDVLKNSYVCSSDNYFPENPFLVPPDGAYYAAVRADGPTDEWCITTNADGRITNVTIGGADCLYMLGHTFWDETFSRRFVEILEREYDRPETAGKLWEDIYLDHVDELTMRVREYPAGAVLEFDTVEEMRRFDPECVRNSGSAVLKSLAARLDCAPDDLRDFTVLPDRTGCSFRFGGEAYTYCYTRDVLEKGAEHG